MSDKEKVTDNVHEAPGNNSTTHFLSVLEPYNEVEVVCYHDEGANGEVSIIELGQNGIKDSISISGKYLRTVAHILLEQADRYENKVKGPPPFPDGLFSQAVNEVETLIVKEEPDTVNEGAVKSKFEFYRSPEDRKEEHPFMTVFFCRDGDIIVRDETSNKPEEICIPKRFVEPLIKLIWKQTNPGMKFTIYDVSDDSMSVPLTATALNLLQQPENKADLEGQKLKALVELTKACIDREQVFTADVIEDIMKVFRQQVGLPVIDTGLIQTETSDNKDGHT